jgi:hypothetical protein
VVQFKHLGRTVSDQNLIQKEIKSISNSGNVCYHSVQNLKSSHLLREKLEYENYKFACGFIYGCETWPVTLMDENILRVFENRLLRRILEWKRDEEIGGWRGVHNEELHNLYYLPIIIIKSRRMRWAGNVARIGAKRNAYRILIG